MLRSDKVRLSIVVGAGSAALALSIISGCGTGEGSHADKRGEGDVKIATVDHGRPHIVNNADDYPNVSFKCDGKYGYMIAVPRHWQNDVTPVVWPDPRCPGWRPDLVAPGQPRTSTQPPPDDN